MKRITLKKIYIWFLLTLNLLFAFIIGLTIPLLESSSRFNFGFIMIPLLIILNYIIIDRFHYYLSHTNKEKENADGSN
ncbi:MAG: archaeosortase H N-terminal-like domain-containing protein [Candidatus Hodarchaeota archaeon]